MYINSKLAIQWSLPDGTAIGEYVTFPSGEFQIQGRAEVCEAILDADWPEPAGLIRWLVPPDRHFVIIGHPFGYAQTAVGCECRSTPVKYVSVSASIRVFHLYISMSTVIYNIVSVYKQ